VIVSVKNINMIEIEIKVGESYNDVFENITDYEFVLLDLPEICR